MFSTSAYSKDYIVVCEAGRWEGNDLSTESSQNQIEIDKNGTYLGKNIFEFSLPANFGDQVDITYESEEYKGLITYFYDHTKYSSDQSYIVFISQPTQIQDRNTIQIPSGWVHLTYNKQMGGFGEDLLSTQSFAKKCELNEK
tara:strand:- start:2242 stop:2667 length:426 start_codon:yes stop_codon:yes gene_type:complete